MTEPTPPVKPMEVPETPEQPEVVVPETQPTPVADPPAPEGEQEEL